MRGRVELRDDKHPEPSIWNTDSTFLRDDPETANKTEMDEQIEQVELPEPRVYMAREVQQLLGLGKSKTYEYLEQVYQTQTPFRVIKVGRLYRVPKKSFDAWLDTVD